MPTPEPETPQPARPAARPVFTDLPALPALGQSAPTRPDRESRWRERAAVIADLPALPPLAQGAPGSPFGLGLAKLRVQLEGPRSRLTDRPAETVSGRIVGGAAERVVVYVNGTPRDVTLDGRTFHAPVGLQVGVNEVRVVARDLQGAETEDTMLLEYVPPAPPRIALLSPKDGHTLSPEDPPVVLVEGQVEDATVSSVVLLVDEERLTIPTSGGRFRHIVPIAAPVVRLGAELVLPGGRPQHAPVVTVRSGIPAGSVGLLVVQWAPDAAGTDVEVAASWRARSDRLGEDVAVALNGVTARGASARVYYMRNLRPGVYTFTLRRGAPGAPGVVRPTLYLPSAGTLVPRPLEAVTLDGHGAAYLARVLWPHGVLWEQDDWFTGKTQSADTVTKFRLPEGISWTERKAVLR